MPKSSGQFDPALYAPVADRIALFWAAYPHGRVDTALHARTEREVVFVARVFRDASDAHPAATGWAAEREGDGEVNAVACLENTETSAIGRALANLGFTAARERPSREEMEKAARSRTRSARVGAPASPAYELQQHAALQTRANVTLRMLRLLEAAQRAGLRETRAQRWRRELMRGRVAHSRLQEWETRLREWTARHARQPR